MLELITQGAIDVASAVGRWVYDFQALVAGLLAIGAARYAAAPVWRQLKDSNLQTRILHRETLAARLTEAKERSSRVEKSIKEPLSRLYDVTHDYEGDPVEISEEEAHYHEQLIRGKLDWYLIALANTESEEIEAAKGALGEAIGALVDTLNDVHWPAHNDQSSEDYSMTDEQWAEVLRRSNEGMTLTAAKVSSVNSAYSELRKAQAACAEKLRLQIAELDRSVAGIQ